MYTMDTFELRIKFFTLILILVLVPLNSYATNFYTIDPVLIDKDSLVNVAQQHHTWAVKNYNVPGMLDSVITRARQAVVIRSKLWKDNPNINLGKSYHNLGTFLKFNGNYKEAKKYLKEAVSVYTTLKHDRVLRSLLELGKIYKQEGDFVSAEEYFKLVIEIAKERNIESKIRAAVVDLGSVYLEAYKDSIAIIHLEKHEEFFNLDASSDKDIVGKFYNNLASTYLRNDIYDKAIDNYKKASTINQSDFPTQSFIHTNLSIAYKLKKDYPNCLKALRKGKDLAIKSGDTEKLAFNHNVMAKYYEINSDYTKALSEFQNAIKLMIPSFNPDDDYTNPSISDLNFVVNKVNMVAYLTDKIAVLNILEKEKYTKEILELFKLGDIVIDDMRSDHFMDETKLYWRKTAFPFYERAIKYCHQIKAYDEAFYFFEKSKSVLLLEGYSFNDAIAKVSSEHQDRYKALKASLNSAPISKVKNINQIENLVNSQQSFERFIDSLSIEYPSLFKKYKNRFLLSLSDFQNEIVKDSTSIYIHYFYGKENVFAYGIGNEKFELYNLGATQEFDSLIVKLQKFFHNSSEIDNNFQTYKQVSNSIFKILLEPIIEKHHKELVILPDGLLATIPFESLISEYTVGGKHRYLIQDRVVRYSYSGSLLNNINDSRYKDKYDVISFEPFNNDKKMKGVNFSGLDNINLMIKNYHGEKASKKALFSAKDGFPILHFSSHGFSHGEEGPKILLANSSISLSEIYTSSLPSDLVFLSACETSLGEISFGEGVQSMARGFTFAGANSVISSLWNVIADPNSKIVNKFYENLSNGQAKHLALHNAKLAYIEDPKIPMFEKSPYYWAGLVYFGESDNIIKSKGKFHNNSKLVFLLAGSFLLGLGFLIYWNKNKKRVNNDRKVAA